ncbi:hypothetical protein D5086_030239 [Populus alba]|uniref:Uncharacterized protein n=1 Tax=Populus alba TaxID=43335 RepID=A0ACC4APE2_POPAL
MLSSLRGSVGFPGCLKRPFKVSELEHSGYVVATDIVSPSNGDNYAEMGDDSCDQDRCSICVPSDSTFQLFVTGSTSASPAIFLSILAEHNLGI